MGWPLLYVGFSLIRGAVVDWYPYPFLDPDEADGYAGVLVSSLGILVSFVAVAFALHWWARRPREESPVQPAPQP